MDSEKPVPRTAGPVSYLDALARLTPWLLLIAACLAVVLVFILLAPYAHPSTDDFCLAAGIRRDGLVEHLWHHYLEWSGRYTGNALYGVYPLLFGMFEGYAYMPVALVVALLCAGAFLLSSLFGLKPIDGAAWLSALVFVCVYLLGMISPASSLYWMAGALSYQTANILLLVALGLMVRLVRRQQRSGSVSSLLAVLLVVIVVAVGCNETGMLAFAAATLLFLLLRLRSGTAKLWPWAAVFITTLLCTAVVYFSPGNAIRAAAFPLRHELARALGGSIEIGTNVLLIWLGNPVLLSATLLVPFATVRLCRRGGCAYRVTKSRLVSAALCTLAVPYVFQFPAWWAMGGWAPARSIDAAWFVFLVGWFITAAMFTLRYMPAPEAVSSTRPRHRYAAYALPLLSILFTLTALGSDNYRLAQSDMSSRAGPWDVYMKQRYALIEAAVASGSRSLVVPDYPGEYPRTVYFNDIMYDARDWRNACYAAYFGLDSIRRGH